MVTVKYGSSYRGPVTVKVRAGVNLLEPLEYVEIECRCVEPEPVLVAHGTGSLCEKCGQKIL